MFYCQSQIIPVEEENGAMKGYKIRYQLVKHVDVDVLFDNPVKEVVVDKLTLHYGIHNLKPYSDYKIEVLGYADLGDGPSFTFIASTRKTNIEKSFYVFFHNILGIFFP